ncbi:recombinase family protein [Maribacter sp. 2307UL18-2]|uniref:recombinase family protein n=1 Tax=Maribacter sp. 2307UL18-2 TaxID=3386274 RepID=UPI0039BD4E91
MKYIAYYRVSTKEQGLSGLGLESQKESIRKFIASAKGNLLAEFTDIASGKNDNRANLNEALIECQKHQAVLVVKKLDRLSRGGFKIAVRLDELGIKYIESDSPQDDGLLKDIKLAMAKDERKKISERTKSALAAKKARGDFLGNPRNLTQEGRLKGAKAMSVKAELNPNNRAAKGALELMDGKGWTLQQKADYLNERGYKTSRGKLFTSMQVSRLLRCLDFI